jgi:hypothetical protein
MSTIGAERQPIDYVQQSIESQLDRLSTRMQRNKVQDYEILRVEDNVYVAYIEPADVSGKVEDAIYIMDVGNIRTGYAVVWIDPAGAELYGADKYKNRVWGSQAYRGFDLDAGCDWQLINDPQEKLLAAELLEALSA